MQEDLDRFFNAILLSTEGMIYNLETNEKHKHSDEFIAFNKLPIIKRILDLSILEFWSASVACGLLLEIDTKNKVLDAMAKKLYKFLDNLPREKSFGKLILPKNSSGALRLGDIIKRKDELAIFYREYGIDDNVQTNLWNIFDTVFTKRTLQYNDACDTNSPCKPNFFAVAISFYEDIFGVKPSDFLSLKFNLFVTIHLSVGVGFYFDEIYSFSTIPLKYLDNVFKKEREKDSIKEKINELKTELTLHKIFYEHGRPQMTDKEYDELKSRLHYYEKLLDDWEKNKSK